MHRNLPSLPRRHTARPLHCLPGKISCWPVMGACPPTVSPDINTGRRPGPALLPTPLPRPQCPRAPGHCRPAGLPDADRPILAYRLPQTLCVKRPVSRHPHTAKCIKARVATTVVIRREPLAVMRSRMRSVSQATGARHLQHRTRLPMPGQRPRMLRIAVTSPSGFRVRWTVPTIHPISIARFRASLTLAARTSGNASTIGSAEGKHRP